MKGILDIEHIFDFMSGIRNSFDVKAQLARIMLRKENFVF